MRTTTVLVVAIAAMLGSASCKKQKRADGAGGGGTTADAEIVISKGGVPPRAPGESRPVAVECPRERAPGKPSEVRNENPQCKVDADCKDGINGRCNEHHGGHGFRFSGCDYDRCFNDSECKGGVCNCSTAGNTCTPPGNCLTDKDCGAGGFCTASYGDDPEGACGSAETYFCRTPRDECVSDADCRNKDGMGSKTCTYGRQVGHWLCVENQMCPVG